MVDNRLAVPCINDMGIANVVDALWLIGGGAWPGSFGVCRGC